SDVAPPAVHMNLNQSRNVFMKKVPSQATSIQETNVPKAPKALPPKVTPKEAPLNKVPRIDAPPKSTSQPCLTLEQVEPRSKCVPVKSKCNEIANAIGTNKLTFAKPPTMEVSTLMVAWTKGPMKRVGDTPEGNSTKPSDLLLVGVDMGVFWVMPKSCIIQCKSLGLDFLGCVILFKFEGL
ncbi:hypothetical protein BDN67DRAFT_985305, partial [Paxillus ammoniavirescens]